jgi:16S rRNA (guanine966-N2)-methyltransferase
MRIVAGELKGRTLRSPRGGEVRPTADRVREAIFSILGPVEGTAVLDLFAGTGALAIEALSRGAATATLVDRVLVSARRNVEELELGDRAELVRADVRRYLRRDGERRFDLVFVDPPYRLADRLETDIDTHLPKHLRPAARVVTEGSARRPLELSLPLLAERRYGDTTIRIHQGGDADG